MKINASRGCFFFFFLFKSHCALSLSGLNDARRSSSVETSSEPTVNARTGVAFYARGPVPVGELKAFRLKLVEIRERGPPLLKDIREPLFGEGILAGQVITPRQQPRNVIQMRIK